MKNKFGDNKDSRSKVIVSIGVLYLILLFLSASDVVCQEHLMSWDTLEAKVSRTNPQYPIVIQQNELLKIELYKSSIDKANSSITYYYRIKLNNIENKEYAKKGLVSQHQTCNSFTTKLFNGTPVLIYRAEYMFEDGEKISAEIKKSDCIFDGKVGERLLTLEQELDKWNEEMSFKDSGITIKKAFYNKIDNSIVVGFLFKGATETEYTAFINRPAKLVKENNLVMCKHFKVFFIKHDVSQITLNYDFGDSRTSTFILRKSDCMD